MTAISDTYIYIYISLTDVSDVKGADFCCYDSHLSVSNKDNVSFEGFDMR